MGGPSRESYLAAEVAREKRLAAMRTRDGVVDLAEWRAAVKAAAAITRLFREAPWFLGVRVVAPGTVGFELEFTILRDEPAVRRCLPSRVDDMPVRVIARNPGRRAQPGSGPS